MPASATANRNPACWRELFFGINPRRTLLRVCLWVAVVNFCFNNIMLPVTVSGISMAPTYQSGAWNLVNKLAYARHLPRRGDVVIIDLGKDGMLIKRIVALPGEVIGIERGTLVVNGKPLRDKFQDQCIPFTRSAVQLHDEEFFVIGDNRSRSAFGVVQRQQILGRVVF